MYEVHVLAEGYSKLREDGIMTANGSCSLVTGGKFKVELLGNTLSST